MMGPVSVGFTLLQALTQVPLMKLAMFIASQTDSADIPGVGIVVDNDLIPIVLAAGGFETLADLLVSPTPTATAQSLHKDAPI